MRKKKKYSEKDFAEYIKDCTIAEDIWSVRQLVIPSKAEMREQMKEEYPQIWKQLKSILNYENNN